MTLAPVGDIELTELPGLDSAVACFGLVWNVEYKTLDERGDGCPNEAVWRIRLCGKCPCQNGAVLVCDDCLEQARTALRWNPIARCGACGLRMNEIGQEPIDLLEVWRL